MIMMSMSFGGSDSFDSGETKAKERLLALAKLHPPTEYEAAQTLMYALSKLQLDLIQMMKKHLTKDEKVRPEKIMLTLLSDQDFMLISMRLGVFMSKMDELSKTLSIFDAT